MEVETKELPPRDWHMDPAKAQTLWGDRQLVALAIGPGGGWRYCYAILEEVGIVHVASERRDREARLNVLIAAEPGWRMVWVVGHDLLITDAYVADSRGVHERSLETERSRAGYESHAWVGQEPLSEPELVELFASIAIPKHMGAIPPKKK